MIWVAFLLSGLGALVQVGLPFLFPGVVEARILDTIAGGFYGAAIAALVTEIIMIEERRQHKKERSEDQRRIAELAAMNKELISGVAAVRETVSAREGMEQLRSETEAQTAYALGVYTMALPTLDVTSMRHQLASIRSLCSDLDLHFSDDEARRLELTPADAATSQRIVALVSSKAKAGLEQRLWCFFELGHRRQWLFDEVDQHSSSGRALAWLESFYQNPFLRLVPRYARSVGRLLEVLRPYGELIPDNARGVLSREVREVFHDFSSVYIQERGTLLRLRRSYWFFIADGALVCFVEDVPDLPGHIFLIGVLNPQTYEVHDTVEGSELSLARVTRDEAGWHCSAHANSSIDDPCFEMQLVLGVTDGGNPPTNAAGELVAEAVVGVRKGSTLKSS